ncbi:MAG: hypothetical protein RLZZ393_1856 [Pseudomonadota bacterium]
MRSFTGCSSMPDASRLARWLEGVWYGGRGGGWLRPFGMLYRLLVAVRVAGYRLRLFRAYRAGIPVIVVGNISVGGTGKTPLAAWVVNVLQSAGHRPGIATRGHGRQGGGVTQVQAWHGAAEVGDEPLLLARRTGAPVCVAARRADAVRVLQSAGCDVVVCDDGLQHLALGRDLEIAVVDGSRGLGNARVLPAGPLRETPSRLREVDFVVVNGAGPLTVPAGSTPTLRMTLSGDVARPVHAGAAPSRPLADFAGRPVRAVAGIGNPARFFEHLRAAGLTPLEHPFPDHHAFQPGDFAFGDDLPVLMTEKDAVKCQSFADHRLWYVPVEASFVAEDAARLSASLESLFEQGERTR